MVVSCVVASLSVEKEFGIEGVEGIAVSKEIFPMNVLSDRLCPFLGLLGVIGGSCVLKVVLEDVRENSDEPSLEMCPFCFRSSLTGEGEGDLELDIHDLRASLENERDIDLVLLSLVMG